MSTAGSQVTPGLCRDLVAWIERQPAWSDLPVLLLTSAASRLAGRLTALDAVAPLGNVTILERPVEVLSLTSTVRASLRARHRQYAARAAMAEMDAVLQALPFADCFGDAHGISRCSAEALRLLGAPGAEALRARGGDARGGLRLRADRDGEPVAAELDPWRRAIAGEASSLDAWLTSAGSGEERRVRSSAAAVQVEGRTLGAVVVDIDLTDLHRLQQELATSEARFRTVSDANLIGVGFADEAGRVIGANDEMLRMMGRTRAECDAGSIHLSESIAPECAESLERTNAELATAGVSRRYDRAFLRPDGQRTPYTGAAAMVDAAAGLHVSVALDLSAQRAAEGDLRDLNRRKNEFLGVLSHELRNPLAPIRNSVHLLRSAPPGSERAVRALAVIERQSAHLARLVDDLLDVTRIEKGKIELRRRRVDACAVVRRTADDYRGLLAQRGLALELQIEGAAPVDADEPRLAQLVGNLLQNTVRFGGGGRTVTVSARAAEAQLEIRVRDEGVGITPELLSRLFSPFVQADESLSRTHGGLGLGLSLVKGLAELHGGAVSARSDGPGRGAEFVVTLPLAAPGTAAAGSATPDAVERPSRILVIEDNVDAAQTLAEVLELAGHSVSVAIDGKSGVAEALRAPPDVVICDLGLPDIDGFEVARRLRADPALTATRLVALSGYAQGENRRQAREAGFDAHVAKPPDPGALRRAMTAS